MPKIPQQIASWTDNQLTNPIQALKKKKKSEMNYEGLIPYT